MPEKFADKVTREEIKEAMKRFFEKGGEINKIEGFNNPALDFDAHDFFSDDSYQDLSLSDLG